VVDLRIGAESGLQLVKQLAELDDNTRIVMLTGFASVTTAVESIKLGAVHYLTKPATADEVVAALHRDEGDASVEPSEQPLSVKRLEWEHLQKVLSEHKGNISAAARALNMHRRTLQRKLAKRPVKE
jgi:two-component system response regulator RegA